MTSSKTKQRSGKIGTERWISHDVILDREMKDPSFKAGYLAERARLALMTDIRELRLKRKLTQQEVAERADMPQSVIARLESGTHGVSLSTLQRVAGVLGKRIGLI